MIRFCNKSKIPLTIVTPYLTDKGIKEWGSLMNKLKKNKIIDEIVFNDWGMYNLFKKKLSNKRWVKGRVLSKQYKDLVLDSTRKETYESILPLFQGEMTDTKMCQDFLAENDVLMVELDNLSQGIHLNLKGSKIKASLYHPFKYISTTRLCPSANCTSKHKRILTIEDSCNFECKKYTFKVEKKGRTKHMILKGNTYFHYLNNVPKDLEKKGITRLVFQPQIPM
jgi:hypothetical protein